MYSRDRTGPHSNTWHPILHHLKLLFQASCGSLQSKKKVRYQSDALAISEIGSFQAVIDAESIPNYAKYPAEETKPSKPVPLGFSFWSLDEQYSTPKESIFVTSTLMQSHSKGRRNALQCGVQCCSKYLSLLSWI